MTIQFPLWKNIPESWLGFDPRWWFKEVGSIFSHGWWAAALVTPAALWGMHWWTGALTALALEIPREFVEQWPIRRWWDTFYDIGVFMIAGALCVGFLTHWN